MSICFEMSPYFIVRLGLEFHKIPDKFQKKLGYEWVSPRVSKTLVLQSEIAHFPPKIQVTISKKTKKAILKAKGVLFDYFLMVFRKEERVGPFLTF